MSVSIVCMRMKRRNFFLPQENYEMFAIKAFIGVDVMCLAIALNTTDWNRKKNPNVDNDKEREKTC